jgi:hypothetical protein
MYLPLKFIPSITKVLKEGSIEIKYLGLHKLSKFSWNQLNKHCTPPIARWSNPSYTETSTDQHYGSWAKWPIEIITKQSGTAQWRQGTESSWLGGRATYQGDQLVEAEPSGERLGLNRHAFCIAFVCRFHPLHLISWSWTHTFQSTFGRERRWILILEQ